MNLFNDSKYTKWYFRIVVSAKNRTPDSIIYSEKHHIIPKSLGGSNDKNNIVSLYFREHFIVHQLLPKMCLNELHKRKMLHALSYFNTSCNNKRILNSRQAKICKEAHILACKGKKLSKEHREKVSKRLKEINHGKDKKHSIETKIKMRIAKANSTYKPSKEKCDRHSIMMSGSNNPKSRRILVSYEEKDLCYKCIKDFHYDSGINYNTLKSIASSKKYSNKFDLKITYLIDQVI